MAAVAVEIADAVKAVIAGATLSQTATVERLYVSTRDVKDMAGLYVCVIVPTSALVPMLTRGSDDFSFDLDIDVLKRFGGDGPMTAGEINAACDPLMLYAEEMLDLFRGKVLAGYATANCTAVANVAAYDPASVDGMRLFWAKLSLTFKKVRTR